MSHDRPQTKLQKTRQGIKAKQKQNLLDKGWVYDGLWWHSPHTKRRYTYQAAVDIEYLRDEWSGPQSLDWTKRNGWGNQFGNSEDD